MASKIIQLEFPFPNTVIEEKNPAQFVYEALKFIIERQTLIQEHNERIQKCLFAKQAELEKVNKEFRSISEFLSYHMMDVQDEVIKIQQKLQN